MTAARTPPLPRAGPTRPLQSPGRRFSAPALAGIALATLTFVGYLPGLGRSLDLDSAQTVGMFIKPGPPWAVFQRQSAFNNHPLFSFLEQLVRVASGRSDAATMRLLPILFGAMAVGVLTWFAARRHGLVAGLAAGALLACNPTFANLSRGVRGYSLLVLCAVVSSVLIFDDRRDRSRWTGVAYVAVAGMGLATHLYMFPVIAGHVGAIVVGGRMDAAWRRRFAGVLAVASLAYAAMAASMLRTMGSIGRVLQPAFPWRAAQMATGNGWASLALAPLVVAGAVLLLRRSRASRGAVAGLVGVLLIQWAVLQSAALTTRFLVWLVPGAAYLVAVAIGRVRVGALLAVLACVLGVAVMASGFTREPTAYRQAAALIRRVDATGARSCVVDVGVSPMLAYLDSPADFTAVTEPAQLDGCDAVFVTAWWPTTADWFARDRAVIAEAELRFGYRRVIAVGDATLVLSNRVLPS